MKKFFPILSLVLGGCVAQYQAPTGQPTASLSFSHIDGGVAEYSFLPTAGECSNSQFIGNIGPGFPLKGVLNAENNIVPANQEFGILIHIIQPGYPYATIPCKHHVTLELKEEESYMLQTDMKSCAASFGKVGHTVEPIKSSGC